MADSTVIQQTTYPAWQEAYYQQQIAQRNALYGIAQNIYNTNANYQPYTGERLQGFTTDQLTAMGMTRDASGAWQQPMDQANQALGGISSYGQTYTPQQIQAQQYNQQYNYSPMQASLAQAATVGNAPQITSGSYNPQQISADRVNNQNISSTNTGYERLGNYFVNAGGISGLQNVAADRVNNANVGAGTIGTQAQVGSSDFDTAAAQRYMNPYTQTALRSSLDELSRQNQLLGLEDRARATSTGAFGGSRAAIVDAERERSYLNSAANMIAQANDQAYAGAQSQFNTDQSRGLQAGQFNVGTEYNRQSQNVGNSLQAALANQQQYLQAQGMNQQAGLQAQQFNVGTNLQAQQYNTDAALRAALANQQQYYQSGLANQQAGMQTGQFNATQNLAAQQYNADSYLRAQLANQQANLTAQQSNQQASSAASQFNIGQNYNAQMANQQSWLQTQLANQQAYNQFGLANQQATNAMSLANADNAYREYMANQSTFGMNSQLNMTAQQANQQAAYNAYLANAGQFNTDQNRQLGLAGLYMQQAPLTQQMGMQDANNLYAMGTAQQQFGQQNLNLGYQDYLTQQQYPYNQYAFLQGAQQGTYFNPQASTTTSTTSPGPSAMQQWGGLGLTGLGILGGTGAFGSGTSSGWLGSAVSGIGSFLGNLFADGGEVRGGGDFKDPFAELTDVEILAKAEQGVIPLGVAKTIIASRNRNEPGRTDPKNPNAAADGAAGIAGLKLPKVGPILQPVPIAKAVEGEGPKTADLMPDFGGESPEAARYAAGAPSPASRNAVPGTLTPDTEAPSVSSEPGWKRFGLSSPFDFSLPTPLSEKSAAGKKEAEETAMLKQHRGPDISGSLEGGVKDLPLPPVVAPPSSGGIVPNQLDGAAPLEYTVPPEDISAGLEGANAGVPPVEPALTDGGFHKTQPQGGIGDLITGQEGDPQASQQGGDTLNEVRNPAPGEESSLFGNGRGWEAMTMLGLGMMASKRPDALGAIGEAGIGASKYLTDRRKEDRDEARLKQNDKRLDAAERRSDATLSLAEKRLGLDAAESRDKSEYYAMKRKEIQAEIDALAKNGGKANSAEVSRLNWLSDQYDLADKGDEKAKRMIELATGSRGENSRRAEAILTEKNAILKRNEDPLNKNKVTPEQAEQMAIESYERIYGRGANAGQAKPATPAASTNTPKSAIAIGTIAVNPNGQKIKWDGTRWVPK